MPSLQKYIITLEYGRKMYDVELTSSSRELAQKRAVIMFMVSRRLPISKTSRVRIIGTQ